MAMLLTSATPVGLFPLGLSASPCGGRTAAALCNFRLPPTSGKKNLNRNGSASAVPRSLGFLGSSVMENRLRSCWQSGMQSLESSRGGGALGSMCSLPVSVESLQWMLVASAAVLLFVKNVAVPKQYLVPLLALELPRDVFNWLRGEYGLWIAFVGLLVKLFYDIPGELKLPLHTLLLAIAAPAQILQYRGSTPGAVASLVLAAYLAVEHYRSMGSVQEAFKSDKLIPTIAILVLVIVPILFFVNNIYV